ncbi:unnamed protein product [Didymodactylos carnosus]|uniref:Uncharacterized protein n=1 Tax=Didymodactylos carnosus TaxID=1234261 RepID=A0A814ZJP8_9BILA|nr:unnamed protein product [Didymodactylos carnosus]CAF4009899.1 unnamed protein product [Didymodactylos carnosus]
MSDEKDVNKVRAGVQQILQYIQSFLEKLKLQKREQFTLGLLNERKNSTTSESLLINCLTKVNTFDDYENALLELTHLVEMPLNSFIPFLSNPFIQLLKEFSFAIVEYLIKYSTIAKDPILAAEYNNVVKNGPGLSLNIG